MLGEHLKELVHQVTLARDELDLLEYYTLPLIDYSEDDVEAFGKAMVKFEEHIEMIKTKTLAHGRLMLKHIHNNQGWTGDEI